MQQTCGLQSCLDWRTTSRYCFLLHLLTRSKGVFGFPGCNATNITLCEYMREMLNLGAYVPFVQENLAQADYWHVCDMYVPF